MIRFLNLYLYLNFRCVQCPVSSVVRRVGVADQLSGRAAGEAEDYKKARQLFLVDFGI